MSALPRTFVLDTTVASQLTATRPDAAVAAWLDAAPPGTLCVPAGAVYELQLGVELARRNGNARAGDFERRLDALLGDGRYRILPMDGPTARIRAALAARPELRHLALPDPRSRRFRPGERLAVAAAALSIGAPVATLDRRAFATIGRCRPSLEVFDPSTGPWPPAPGARTEPQGDADVYPARPRRSLPDGRVNRSLTASEVSGRGGRDCPGADPRFG